VNAEPFAFRMLVLPTGFQLLVIFLCIDHVPYAHRPLEQQIITHGLFFFGPYRIVTTFSPRIFCPRVVTMTLEVPSTVPLSITPLKT